MTDRYSASTDPQTEEFTKYEVESSANFYENGIKHLAVYGYELTRTIYAKGLHQVFIKQTPQAIQGITYPAGFKVRQLIGKDTFRDFSDAIMSIPDEPTRAFWSPMFMGDPRNNSALKRYTELLMEAEVSERKTNTAKPWELGNSWTADGVPKSWIPKREWFDASFHEVQAKDILTLFPEAEQEMLMLIFGRLAVGRANALQEGTGELIDHTSRMAAIIVGLDAGLGKSTLFEKYLDAALSKVGYLKSQLPNSGRFNWGAAIQSPWTYRDDTTENSLKAILSSDKIKTIVTNGWMAVEEKGVNAIEQPSHSVLILNTNSYNPNLVYELDSGVVDRLKFIATLSRPEILAAPKTLTGVSAGSPDARPFAHIPWLAEKLGVSTDAVMLWLMRLAADNFHRIINDKSDPTVNRLEKIVRDTSMKLRRGYSKEVNAQILIFFNLMQAMLGRRDRKWLPLDALPWSEIFSRAQAVLDINPFDQIEEILKQHWIEQDRPILHPYAGLIQLNTKSIEVAAKRWRQEDSPASLLTISEKFRTVFKSVLLKTGMPMTSDFVWLTEHHLYIGSFREELAQANKEIIERLSELPDSVLDKILP